MVTAAQNEDGSTAIVVLNMEETERTIEFKINDKKLVYTIDAQALQTIFIP